MGWIIFHLPTNSSPQKDLKIMFNFFGMELGHSVGGT